MTNDERCYECGHANRLHTLTQCWGQPCAGDVHPFVLSRECPACGGSGYRGGMPDFDGDERVVTVSACPAEGCKDGRVPVAIEENMR